MELRLAYRPDTSVPFISGSDRSLLLNCAAIAPQIPRMLHAGVAQLVALASERATTAHGLLTVDTSTQIVQDDLLALLERDGADDAAIDHIRDVIAAFAFVTRSMEKAKASAANVAALNLESQGSVLRWGIVELRVIENYLLRPDALRTALENVLRAMNDEGQMFAGPKHHHHLATDDAEWALRRLMTNAGFYAKADVDAAWTALEDWAQRYIAALEGNHQFIVPPGYPFYFKIQRSLWRKSRAVPRLVQYGNPFAVYRQLAGRDVLFLTPLAESVTAQFESGRIKDLYRNHAMPEYRLRAIPASISTWPNGPHDDWTATFGRMCEAIDHAFRQRPFDVFIASAGCYGMPICDHVRRTYGSNCLYFGNIANAFFGVRQNSTASFMAGRTNDAMWIKGDLSHVPYLDRIDGGRYV